MNVSSVKNLNGETFSAVQDAALTNVVQTNSGNWQDITAYQNASAGYLTAHQDLSDYQTTAGMVNYYTTADANTLSGMLSGAIDYVSANAGDEFPASANEAITAYQNASGTYLTSHQDISNKLDTSAIDFFTNLEDNTYATGISGKPIGAVLAEKANQDVLGRDITAHYAPRAIIANASGSWDEATNYVQTNSGSIDETVSTVETNSATWGAGSTPTYEYTDNNLISAIDTSGLYATSALESKSANILNKNGVIGAGAYFSDNSQANHNVMMLNPTATPFGTTSGIYSPLQYAAGAVTTYGSSSYNTQYFGGFLKGNEWYVSNATAGQALRGETHASRGVHLSGATTAGYSFDLSIKAVSGLNSTGTWKYGVQEDRALRTVSALEYNAVDEISGIAGSAIAQYGAEKQWLQHDDTIVHVANSAQYAFGVNVSALQRLMGIDETVLFNSTTSAGVLTANLSEPLSSFNTIEVYSNRTNAGSLNLMGYTKFKTDYKPEFISIIGNTRAGNNETYLIYELFGVSQTALTYISGTNLRVQNTTLTVLNSPNFANAGITKVIGIGRKEV